MGCDWSHGTGRILLGHVIAGSCCPGINLTCEDVSDQDLPQALRGVGWGGIKTGSAPAKDSSIFQPLCGFLGENLGAILELRIMSPQWVGY